MPTLNLVITTGNDDADESSAGSVVLNAAGPNIDATTEWMGFRFQNVTIPPGSTINSATFSLVPFSLINDEPNHDFFGEAADNAAAFSTSANNISGRSRTTASVTWASADLGADGTARFNAPDMSAIIQEIVNRAGWASGNAIVIVGRGSADGARDLQPTMYDSDPTKVAHLDITYTAAGKARLGYFPRPLRVWNRSV